MMMKRVFAWLWAGAAGAAVGGCAAQREADVARGGHAAAAPAYAAYRAEAQERAGAAAPVAAEDAPRDVEASEAPVQTSAEYGFFGDQGTTWWSVQGGASWSSDAVEPNVRLSLHRFFANDFEGNVSVGAWYHAQDGDNEGSGAFDIGFRWHFVNRGREQMDGLGMTAYLETGIGMMYATGDVPTDGTRYNFTPRAGIGATWPIGDGPNRFDAGVRWQHFSNASSSGSDDNPARDGVMIYAGFIFPF